MSRILQNVHKSVKLLSEGGFLDDTTMREFDAMCLPKPPRYTAKDVQRIRASTKASQAVFAAFLNVRTLTVSAWEQGTKSPSGPAAKLLNLVEMKGLDALV